MSSSFVMDVTRQQFTEAVLKKSRQVPVLVDFWAPWCGPCRNLSPVLEKLAQELNGRFILAKVNTDSEQDLAMQFGIRGIPHCKLFKDGQQVDSFQGAQPESEVRAFLNKHLDDADGKPLEVAKQLLSSGSWDEAGELIQSVLAKDPEQQEALLLLARWAIQTKDFAKAEAVLAKLPEPLSEVQNLKGMLRFAQDAELYGSAEECEKRFAENPKDLESLYQWGLVLSLEDKPEEAMDRFLQLLRLNKNYGEGKARKAMLAMLEVLGPEHPLTHEYRRKLASVIL